MWDIFKSLLNKFTKQFIPLKKKNMYNKKVKPKWMNEKIETIIRETKIPYQIQRTNSTGENQKRYRGILQSKKGEIRKTKRDYAK